MPNRGQEGTGRHPHKSTTSGGEHKTSGRKETQSESNDLKSREYRGPDGQIHHHTRTYERDHGKKH